ncbi:hypothetical protein M9H77_16733 [Catharanthus roseus]|uniref:Uncharacterized protein n=1 Tax=Catharanthus roseus TaxID=4058 RepID=A0ACC0B2J9_CATRO|nr:hypothetical protein M9H77_16733 [Catharanthus roseus]
MIAPRGFQSQKYVPPHPPQSGNSNFEEKVLSTLKGLEANPAKPQILDLHTQCFGNLETQIVQLANAINRRDEGKLPNHSIENHRSNYHEQAKAVIILEMYARSHLQQHLTLSLNSSGSRITHVNLLPLNCANTSSGTIVKTPFLQYLAIRTSIVFFNAKSNKQILQGHLLTLVLEIVLQVFPTGVVAF